MRSPQFYDDWERSNHPARAARYELAMEQVYKRYPARSRCGRVLRSCAERECVGGNANGQDLRETEKGGGDSESRAATGTEPSGRHSLLDSQLRLSARSRSLALAAARSYARIAPSSAHALHMPSHIFTRLGLWSEDIATNIRSENAAKDYARRNHLAGVWDEQLHAMDYLAYAYLQQARDREARAVLDELKAIRKTDPESFKCAYSFAAIPARWALERRDWSEASDLKIEPADFPWPRFQWAEAITHFARAIGAARSGDSNRARVEVEKLAEIQKQLAGAKDNYDWATQVEIQRRAAAAWLAKADGKDQEALELMRSAADLEDSTEKHPVTPGAVLPARELLGDLLLELNRPGRGVERISSDRWSISPNRFNGLYGAARSAELAGDRDQGSKILSKAYSNIFSRQQAGASTCQRLPCTQTAPLKDQSCNGHCKDQTTPWLRNKTQVPELRIGIAL